MQPTEGDWSNYVSPHWDGAPLARREDYPQQYALAEELTARLAADYGREPRHVAIYLNDSQNASASADAYQFAFSISRDWLESLTPSSFEALAAHEFGHYFLEHQGRGDMMREMVIDRFGSNNLASLERYLEQNPNILREVQNCAHGIMREEEYIADLFAAHYTSIGQTQQMLQETSTEAIYGPPPANSTHPSDRERVAMLDRYNPRMIASMFEDGKVMPSERELNQANQCNVVNPAELPRHGVDGLGVVNQNNRDEGRY